MIAGLFSFYNAGSATNQSNHMYKLGPLHQGILMRGAKTSSSSYALWPSRLGPFNVLVGKHMANFDTATLPFSYVNAVEERTTVVPAMKEIAESGIRLTVYSQDDPGFPEDVPGVVDDTALEASFHFDIETVPTLIRMKEGERGRSYSVSGIPIQVAVADRLFLRAIIRPPRTMNENTLGSGMTIVLNMRSSA